ncbi:Lysine-specific demethylase SE14 [Dichanthelium oligosanthes]|uniref:Lysine-specific demethylase SE14 n=1 Tax=Dichanthelium oligosanthes TaxID=888268 RepID=A0A1E5WDR2_9POAL|nr:Lysine-specific demethylase SE14 [Dichanthelium oligosanthes]
MRIRRYAARLLSSTNSTGSAPSSPPPPPAASWLHAAAAADDCCAFCELSRSAPQEGPDAVKHKGHIAGRVPESDVRGDERVRQAHQPPAPEAKKCKTDHGPNVNKTSVGRQALRGASGISEAAAKPEVAGGATLVSEADAESSVKPEVTGGNSLVNGWTAELEVLKGAPDEAAHDPETAERVSSESKAATVPGVTSIAQQVTGVASVMHETTKVESAGEDTGRASCNVDNTAALDKPQLPSCDPNIGNVQVGNAGETVASTLQPSGCDAAKAGGSVNSRSNGPVRAKGPTVEGRVRTDRSVTPSVSCLFDTVARSIGTSGRTDVICYARRRGKRKLELLEVKTENIELEEETLDRTGCSESVLSTAESADVKLVDIKKELMDNAAASKVKKMKRNGFDCNIDYCRMTFKTKTELSVHKKNMCTVKSCSRHFRSHKYLRRHQSVHNDDMPYKCPWDGCVMAFKWSWDRAEHFKVHAGVKPYKCTTPGCNKIYKFVSDFTRHRRRCKPQR